MICYKYVFSFLVVIADTIYVVFCIFSLKIEKFYFSFINYTRKIFIVLHNNSIYVNRVRYIEATTVNLDNIINPKEVLSNAVYFFMPINA